VEIGRVPVGRPVDTMPPVRQEGDTTIVPVVEEIIVVGRRLILKEEVRIRRLQVRNLSSCGSRRHLRETNEEPVVSKTACVTEEVSLHKEAADRVKTIRDIVRRDVIEFEQVPGMARDNCAPNSNP
jgi:stress response protein YsnF